MKILSLFDGISCGYLALKKAGIPITQYYAAEIDKFAIKCSSENNPDIIHIGSVTDVSFKDGVLKTKDKEYKVGSFDLVIGGSPCQSFSVAGDGSGFNGKSGLFWDYIRILREVNPKYFLLENVVMKKEWQAIIDKEMAVEPIKINSSLLSAQNRNRLYWTNIPGVTQPEDKGILLRDILEENTDKVFDLSKQAIDYMSRLRNGRPRWEYHKNPLEGKAACLTANMYKGVPYGVLQITGGALRGRYVSQGGIKTTEQKLEVRDDNKSNCLTTVQKDSLVIYRPCVRIKEGNVGHVANATDIKGHEAIKRVYGSDGKAPTLTTMGGGHREPKVLVNESATATGKSYTLTASYNGAVAWNSIERKQRTMVPVEESSEQHPNIYNGVKYRKLTPLECERLQTIPDNYTKMLSNTQRYKCIGNGWTVDVIAHIFKGILEDEVG